MDKILNNESYIKIPLVGNRYCSKKPSSNDTIIALVDEPENEYDKNAIRVISIRDSKKVKLGYVISDMTKYVKKHRNKMEFVTIIVKKQDDKKYYILVFILKN